MSQSRAAGARRGEGKGGGKGGGKAGRGCGRYAKDSFARMDYDGDGVVTPEEFKFAQMDLDGDGVISPDEFRAAQQGAGRPGGGRPGFRPGKPHSGGTGGACALAAAAMGAAAAATAGGRPHTGAHVGAAGGGHGAWHGGGCSPAVRALQQVSRIHVQEKVDYLEAGAALLGAEVEMPNRYAVLDTATRRQLFYAQEQTGFMMRQMKQCCGDCAPWSLDIVSTSYMGAQPAIHVDRPFSCTCLCLNRPIASVYDAMSGQLLGSISDPCTCLSTVFHVRDAHGSEVFEADGGCCQPGLWMPCPIGPCAQVDFDIKDARNGRKVGHIRKQLPGPLSWLLAPDVDSYAIDFGQVCDPTQKALLMSLAIYMDFRYWNDSSRDKEDFGLPFLGADRQQMLAAAGGGGRPTF